MRAVEVHARRREPRAAEPAAPCRLRARRRRASPRRRRRARARAPRAASSRRLGAPDDRAATRRVRWRCQLRGSEPIGRRRRARSRARGCASIGSPPRAAPRRASSTAAREHAEPARQLLARDRPLALTQPGEDAARRALTAAASSFRLESHRRRRVRERADRDESTPVAATAGRSSSVMPPETSTGTRPATRRTASSSSRGVMLSSRIRSGRAASAASTSAASGTRPGAAARGTRRAPRGPRRRRRRRRARRGCS